MHAHLHRSANGACAQSICNVHGARPIERSVGRLPGYRGSRRGQPASVYARGGADDDVLVGKLEANLTNPSARNARGAGRDSLPLLLGALGVQMAVVVAPDRRKFHAWRKQASLENAIEISDVLPTPPSSILVERASRGGKLARSECRQVNGNPLLAPRRLQDGQKRSSHPRAADLPLANHKVEAPWTLDQLRAGMARG